MNNISGVSKPGYSFGAGIEHGRRTSVIAGIKINSPFDRQAELNSITNFNAGIKQKIAINENTDFTAYLGGFYNLLSVNALENPEHLPEGFLFSGTEKFEDLFIDNLSSSNTRGIALSVGIEHKLTESIILDASIGFNFHQKSDFYQIYEYALNVGAEIKLNDLIKGSNKPKQKRMKAPKRRSMPIRGAYCPPHKPDWNNRNVIFNRP
jgi:hypothetical protein